MSIYEELSRISEQVQTNRHLMTLEVDVEEVSVKPFIRALGYSPENLSEVKRQFPILNSDAADFAILRDGKPAIIIEVKKLGVNLDKHWKQLFEYFNATEAAIGILTNGIEYRFYSDMRKVNTMDEKPFHVIDLLQLDKQKVDILEGFTKAQFDPVSSIRFLKIRAKVETILQNPDKAFVKHVIQNIHVGTKWKQVVDGYKPLVKKAIDEYVDKEIERRLSSIEINSSRRTPDDDGRVDPTDIPPRTMLDGSAKIPIYAEWEGHNFTTTLRLWRKIANCGTIVKWDGEWRMAKEAGELARSSAGIASPKYVNGMTFWHFRDPKDNKLRPIRDLQYAWHEDWDLILRVIANAND